MAVRLGLLSEKAKEIGIRYKLLTMVSSNPGEAICEAAEAKRVQFIVVGQRSIGPMHRLILGSVSKHVLKHATCNVILCKGPYGAELVHDGTKSDARNQEEVVIC